jgi:hypothetical protein
MQKRTNWFYSCGCPKGTHSLQADETKIIAYRCDKCFQEKINEIPANNDPLELLKCILSAARETSTDTTAINKNYSDT